MVNTNLSTTEGLMLNFEGGSQHTSVSPQGIMRSVATILNLPVELKQSIALKLNAKDYASLRESCRAISQGVDSFHQLDNKIKLGFCSRDYSDKIKKILLNQSVSRIIADAKNDYIVQVLKSIRIDSSIVQNRNTFISVTFSTKQERELSTVMLDEYYPHWVEKAFMFFKEAIYTSAENIMLITIKKRTYPLTPWVIGVRFEHGFICYSQMNRTFANLNHIFNEVKGKEKLIIAVMTSLLKSFLLSSIPHGLVKNDIEESTRELAELLTFADEIHHLLQEEVY